MQTHKTQTLQGFTRCYYHNQESGRLLTITARRDDASIADNAITQLRKLLVLRIDPGRCSICMYVIVVIVVVLVVEVVEVVDVVRSRRNSRISSIVI